MARFQLPALEDAPERSKPALDFIEASLGWVPNYFRLCASSPDALNAHALLDSALTNVLDYETRTRIALAVSTVNRSDYCVAGHSFLASQILKLPSEEILLSRCGVGNGDRMSAAVFFACRVAEERGHVRDEDLASARRCGLTDRELVEIVAVVAATCFTNFLNSVAQTEIDYPTRSEVN